MLLVVGVLGVYTYLSNRDAQQQKLLVQAATTLGDSPMQSLRHAVDAYNLNHNEQARSAVLAAASSPRSRVVAGPKPMMIGMILTPDARHVVAYGAHGSIRVIGDNGFEEHKAEAVGDLRGTVIRSVGEEAAVNPDASRVALGTDQGTVAVINTTTGEHIDIDTEVRSTPAVKWIGPAANGLVLVVSGSGAATTYSSETGKHGCAFP